MHKPTSPKSYAVGYKKPPTATQFKKGISGNPSGRPRNIRIGMQLLRAELNSKITVEVDGTKKRLSKEQVIFRQLVNSAIKLEPRAISQLFKLLGNPTLHEAAPIIDKSAERINNMTDEQLEAAI